MLKIYIIYIILCFMWIFVSLDKGNEGFGDEIGIISKNGKDFRLFKLIIEYFGNIE